jgi:CHASE2 domain-containing sensor protein
MKRFRRIATLCFIGACLAAISAVSWHSVEEIHYLKTFYPRSFSVEEACYAALVEGIKVALISFPLLLIVVVGVLLLRRYDKDAE